MVTDFYSRYSRSLVILLMAALPVLTIVGELVPSNNDIETWLPRNSQIRTEYDEFCHTFGADETILIAFERPFPAPEKIQALSGRLEGLSGIAACWTRQHVLESMLANEVSEDRARERLVNLMSTSDDSLETLMVSINQHGLDHRMQTVAEVRHQLSYCDLEDAVLAGAPVVATQLDKLGSRKRASILFGLTLLICFVLMRFNIGCWKTSGALMVGNLIAIQSTMSAIWLSGQEMNFIMSSLPVMVMVFTTAASIHFIGHYRHEYPHPDAIGRSMSGVIMPSLFATITTIIGLVSLAVSDVGPIPAFGQAAALGTFFSFAVGVFVTPAVLLVCQYNPAKTKTTSWGLQSTAMFVLNRPVIVLVPGILLTAFCSYGLVHLRSLISPIEFLPENDPVLHDTLLVANELTSPTSIEAVVNFGNTETSFIERLREVRRIEEAIAKVDNVCHALSLADFFPEEISDQTISLSRLAAASGDDRATASLLADGSRLWRISIRLDNDEPSVLRATMNELSAQCDNMPVRFTGIGPLLEFAQGQIFEGFWKSFASAFVLITIVMILALRSLSAGLVAMIPNLTPILLIFGTLGWADYPIDIGIMMTASIALGLAVDGTFHFLFSYQGSRRKTGCRYRAVRKALLQTGMPIISSAVISGTGLLALGLSPFRPTMRFGVLMFCLLLAALIGDLLLLPAFLALGARRKRLTQRVETSDDATRVAA